MLFPVVVTLRFAVNMLLLQFLRLFCYWRSFWLLLSSLLCLLCLFCLLWLLWLLLMSSLSSSLLLSLSLLLLDLLNFVVGGGCVDCWLLGFSCVLCVLLCGLPSKGLAIE